MSHVIVRNAVDELVRELKLRAALETAAERTDASSIEELLEPMPEIDDEDFGRRS